MVEALKKNGGFNLPVMSFIFTILLALTGATWNGAVSATEMRKDIESIKTTQIEDKRQREKQQEKDTELRAKLAASIDNLSKTIHKMQVENAKMFAQFDMNKINR